MDWLRALMANLENDQPAVLVTIAAVKGSAPRGPGAKMAVTGDGLAGTIGGGELEYQATETARALIAEGATTSRLQHVRLGPEMGQCCGGAADLLFEPITEHDRAWVRAIFDRQSTAPLVRAVEAESNPARKWILKPGEEAPDELSATAMERLRDLEAAGEGAAVIPLEDGARLIADVIVDDEQILYLFGAGHVGRALVQALAPLPFRVTWVDGRPGVFPAQLPPGVTAEEVDPPRFAVERAPAGAYYLIMTHSHALDLEVCEAVLARGDAAYLGLIGSATKKARFLKRLEAKGYGAERLAELHCPIGLPGIAGKEPAVIAAGVAADLLMRRSARGGETTGSEERAHD